MLNYIWLALVLLAVTIGGWNGQLKEVTDGAFDGAKTAVTIALGLIGIMALWLGVMRLAERAGLIQKLARGLRPVMRRLFPGSSDHPAMGSMLMNMAANMLGLGNAATPLGLRAMRDLETLNPHPGTATNAMCTFLAINTSSVSSSRRPRSQSWWRRARPIRRHRRHVAPRHLVRSDGRNHLGQLLGRLPWFREADVRPVAGVGDPRFVLRKSDDATEQLADSASSRCARGATIQPPGRGSGE